MADFLAFTFGVLMLAVFTIATFGLVLLREYSDD